MGFATINYLLLCRYLKFVQKITKNFCIKQSCMFSLDGFRIARYLENSVSGTSLIILSMLNFKFVRIFIFFRNTVGVKEWAPSMLLCRPQLPRPGGPAALCHLPLNNEFDLATGRTALQRFCVASELSLIQLMIHCGADSRLCSRDGWSSVHMAAWAGLPEVMLYVMDCNKRC